MQIEDFQAIVTNQKPRKLQNKVVSIEEAAAVVSNYERLNDALRQKYLNMPVNNIVEFAQSLAKKQNGSFKTYIKSIESRQQEPEDDVLETEVQPILEVLERPPESLNEVAEEKVQVAQAPPAPPTLAQTQVLSESQERFFTKLLERFDTLSEVKPQPISVNIETTEAHVERLVELEESMVNALSVMTEHVQNVALQSNTYQTSLTEVLEHQQLMIERITNSQARIVDCQDGIISAIANLAEKVNALIQTPPTVSPIINMPAPVVNVTSEGSRRLMTTKLVERDKNGLILKVIEDATTQDE